MKKQLFIENSPFLTRLIISDDLKESIQIKQGKNNALIVKNVPATILNRSNQNGRIYSTIEMQKALDMAKQQIATKQLLCQADEHPEGSFVAPTHASHVITNAYIKKNIKLEVEGEKGAWDVLFCDIEVLNTTEGKNLQALLLSGVSCGTSIRGLGDMDGDQVVNYEFLGFDIVSNPSSGTFTNMPIYEAKIESIEENALNEATKFTVSTYASNTTHDLGQAMEFQDKAATSLQYGTITNMNTKMDQEVDPKTGVEKTVGEVEVETSDDTSDLKTALEIAGRAFTNPENINVTSITIEKVDEDDIKDSVMQGGTFDTLKEEDPEVSAGKALSDLWKQTYGDKTIVVRTASENVGVFPAYDGKSICFGPLGYKNSVSHVDGSVPYNVGDRLETVVGEVIDKAHEMYGFESDLLDSAQEQKAIVEQDGEWVICFIDADNKVCFAGDNVSELVNDLAAAKKFGSKEEAEEYKANNFQSDPESVDPESGIMTKYVDIQVKKITDGGKTLKDEDMLKEAELTQGMWIKTELLDPTAVYYVDEVTDQGVYLIKNSENGHRIFIETDGSYVFPWSEVKNEEESEEILPEASQEGEIEQDGNTLTIDVDGNEVEKEFKSDEEASIAKAGLENGQLTADVMYEEGNCWALKVSAGDYADWFVTERDDSVDVTADENLAIVFPTEEEAKQYQIEKGCEEYEYNNGLRCDVVPVQMGLTDDEIYGKQEETGIGEKLYDNEDPASDPYEQVPVVEEIKDIKVTLGDIAYDVDDEPDFEGDPAEIEEILNQLPDTIEIELNGVDVPEENAEQFIYQKACEQTGLPIKNATIISVEEIQKEAVTEEGEEDIELDASTDIASDEMSGLEGDSGTSDIVDGGDGIMSDVSAE